MTLETHRQFVQLFIVKNKRDRYAKPAKLQDELRDTRHFDARFVAAVPKADCTVEGVLRWFESRGASQRCYVVVGGDHEGEFADLNEALREAMFSGEEHLLFSPDGACAYYEHHHGERFFLSRKR